jgi:hypothetical protein
MSVPDDFDWSADNPDLVVGRQPAIAVYENASGAITIRREREWDEEDDTFIVVTKTNVPAFAQAMLCAAGLEPGAQLLLPPPSVQTEAASATKKGPTTGAVRQKRYRNRQRDANRDGARNGSDAHNVPASLFANS